MPMYNQKFPRLATGILFVLLLILSGCASKEEAAKKFHARGIEFFNQGDISKARIEFLNVIQRTPKFAEAYYYLGLIAKQEGDLELVYENMSIAMNLDETNLDAKANVAELLVYGQKFDEALELAEEILAQDSNSYEGLRVKAAAYVGQKNFAAADAVLDQAQKLRPEDASLYALKAVIAREQNNLESTLKHLNRAIELAEDKAQYLALRSGIHRELGDVAALEKDFRGLIKEQPDEPQHVYALSKILIKQERHADAEALLTEFTDSHPANIQAKQVLVETVLASDKARAKTMLDGMIAELPEAVDLLFFRVRLLFADEQRELALNELEALSLPGEDNTKVRLKAKAMIADMYFREEKVDLATALLEENLTENNQHEASLLLKANHALTEKDFDTAIAALRTVLRNNPRSEQGLVLLGNVYLESGSELLADDSFRQALDFNPSNLDAAIPVVQKLIASDDLERSDNIITTALFRKPKDPRLLALLTQIKLSKGEWSNASSLIERLKNIDGNTAYATFLEGRVHQGQQRYKEAIVAFKKALELNPTLSLALQGLSASYFATSNQDGLISFLEKFQEKNPENIDGYRVAAEVYVRRNDLNKAKKHVATALTQEPTWIQGYALQAGYEKRLGNAVAATQSYKTGIERNPDDAYLKVLLARHYETNDENERAELMYERLQKENPNNLVAINNYAAFLLEKVPSEENIKRALTIAKKLANSSEPLFLDTYGWALVKNKQFVEGEQFLRIAADAEPNIAEISYHLGVALVGLNRTEEARNRFKKALRDVADSSPLKEKITEQLSLL